MTRPLPRTPVVIDRLLDDPGLVPRLVEQHQPYYPVQRYFRNATEYASSTGSDQMVIAPNFRGDWAYDAPLVEGVEPILHHEALCDAARRVFDAQIARPQQVYCNLTWQLPFPQGPGHTDVPAFRGVDRTRYPVQLLSVMGHSGLFERYRVYIATAVAWFYKGRDGGFEYWPDGPQGPAKLHEGDIDNTAIVGDNDFMYHRVRPVGRRQDGLPGPMTLETRLARRGGDQWELVENGVVLGEPTFDDLRISISWKANVFRDAEAARVYDDKLDELSIETAFAIFYEDLEVRGVPFARSGDPVNDRELFALLSDTYVELPGSNLPERRDP